MFTGSGEWHLPGGHANPELKPGHDGGTVPESKRSAGLHGFLQQFVLLLLPTVKVALPRQTTDAGHAVRLKKTKSNHHKIDLFLVHTTSRWAICPICPTCTISVSPKWGCADRGAVTKPPLRDFSPLSFLPNILQTDKLVNKASSFEPSQQKKYSTFLERI